MHTRTRTIRVARATLLVWSLGASVWAQQSETSLRLEPPEEPVSSAREEVEDIVARMLSFGEEGSTYWSVTGEAAFADDSTDYGARLGVHHFLADRFEIHASLGVWGHAQDGDDAASLNPSLGFRYHVVWRDAFSLYLDAGVGVLFSTDEVPFDGTRTNFTPRAGVGATFPVGDDGARLDLGVRWHHISNASTSGTDDNPSRDGIGVYLGLIIPFGGPR